VADYCSVHSGCEGPVGADGKDGSVTPGDYQCPEDQFVAGFTVAVDGSVTLNCQTAVPPQN
jgi:hypothetical protein